VSRGCRAAVRRDAGLLHPFRRLSRLSARTDLVTVYPPPLRDCVAVGRVAANLPSSDDGAEGRETTAVAGKNAEGRIACRGVRGEKTAEITRGLFGSGTSGGGHPAWGPVTALTELPRAAHAKGGGCTGGRRDGVQPRRARVGGDGEGGPMARAGGKEQVGGCGSSRVWREP